MIETYIPASRKEWLDLRMHDVTSTEVAALFNISPYATEFELWYRKKAETVVELDGNERMRWGERLQDAIANGIAEDYGWDIRHMSEYMRIPELRMGASFDYAIGDDGLLEVKNVDALVFRDGWLVEGDDLEAPPHIELQIQHQLAVSGRKYARIGALIGGNRVALIHRDADTQIIETIKMRVKAFWESIEANKPPHPDYVRDCEFISKLYNYAEPGKILDARDDAYIARMCANYREASEAAKKADERKQAIKAELLTRIGSAEKVLGEDYSITASLVGPAHVEYEREGYRLFKINWRKQK
jgi:putative phage-type endonuclease